MSVEQKTKVMHFINSTGVYGAEHMLLNLVDEQRNQGMDVCVFNSNKVVENVFKENVKVKPANYWTGSFIKEIRFIEKLINENDITVLHSHGYRFNIILTIIKFRNLLTRRKKLISVTTVHGYTINPIMSKMSFYRIFDYISMIFVNRIIVVSPKLRKLIIFKILSRKVTYIPNGISRNMDRSAKNSFINANDNLRLLAVGRLATEKNYSELIKACAKFKDIKLKIVGDGPLRANLEETIKETKQANRIELTGFLDDIDDVYQKSSASVICSLTEGLPLVLLESMRLGIPILCTRVGAIEDVLGVDYPLYIDGFNYIDIEKAIMKFSKMDSSDRIALGNKLVKIFDKSYTSEKMALSYKESYKVS